MRRIIYWFQRRKRIKEKHCGQCCLICEFYRECSGEIYEGGDEKERGTMETRRGSGGGRFER